MQAQANVTDSIGFSAHIVNGRMSPADRKMPLFV
ncbi:hypothetical protein SFHH103_03170 [Sinorhizobium fredii HH103]|uniref:Uncharacterized protein n=1 Tax=Sinorhizobium fredii (strain HH103) TaxID=1117943 RepID=G9A297_SINF1|nr:hypothetical protein SFHH103_03170 [Sinorhizobium fredii HH103]